MKSDAYWSGRLDALNESQLGKGEDYVRRMQAEYDKAMASLQRDIDVFYKRFAANNGIVDMHAARQVLKAGELKEFKWSVEEYIKAGRENAIDQRWMRELENASIRVRVTRLEALQTQMQQHIEMLSARKEIGAREVLGGIYRDNYYRSIFEVQKGLGVGSSFAQLDEKHIEKLLSSPWAPDGANFSGRIWKDKTKLITELRTALTQSLIRGDSSDRVIAAFAERMGVSRSDAARLVMTESAFISGQSRLDAYKELGVERYKYTATLDTRTSSICRSMDGEVYPISEAQAGVNYPPLHAHCRSTTIPHFEDNVKERAARDEAGETYNVPGDTTYKDWHREHVEPDTPLKRGDDESGTPAKGTGNEPQSPAPAPKAPEPPPAPVVPEPAPSPQPSPVAPEPPPPKLVDEIDTPTPEIVEEQIKEYEKTLRKEAEEHAYVVTPKGEVYHAEGKKSEVEISPIGKSKLKDSIVTHNHPDVAGEPGGSFSRQDVIAFLTYGMQELRAVDSKYTYKLARKPGTMFDLSVESVLLLLEEAKHNYRAKMTIEQLLAGYDAKHLTMIELAALIESLIYERSESN